MINWMAVRRACAILLMASLVWGCASIRLVSDYDEQIDTGLTALYADTTVFVDRMIAKAQTPDGAYDANQAFYDTSLGKIAALTVRAEAHKALDSCPSTALVSKALASAKASSPPNAYLAQIPKDDCQVVLFSLLKRSFEDMRTFHRAQGAAGIPASARGPLLDGGVGAVIRAGIAVEVAKKSDQSLGAKP